VRGDFPFEVRFKTIAREEYESLRRTGSRHCTTTKKKLIIDGIDADTRDTGTSLDSGLVDLLLHMDEKLDHIMATLSKNEAGTDASFKGKGLNISGSVMKLEVDRQVQSG
jgi:hypothetical protein